MSWNVNGVRACARKGLLNYIQNEDPDVLCLQETKAHPDQLDDDLKTPKGRVSYWSSAIKKGYSGTATYLKGQPEDVYYGINIKKFDSEGRFVVTELGPFALYNVYFPNGASSEERHNYKMEFLKKFLKHLKKRIESGDQVMVVGDFNVAHKDIDVFDPVRLSKVSGFLPVERQWFSSFLEAGFIDTFRYKYPDKSDTYTWWSYRENARIANRGWRIDYICVTSGLADKIKDVVIQERQEGSDHCPISIDLDI